MTSPNSSHHFFIAFRAWTRLTHRLCSLSSTSTQPYRQGCLRSRIFPSVNYSTNSQPAAASKHIERPTTDNGARQGKSDASENLRFMMRGMPHSVVVVTACKDVDWPFPKEFTSTNLLSPYYTSFCGATISSFTSVTLGPPAVISFNLRIPSKTLRGILKHKHFRINMLKADGHGAAIAQAFISGNHEDAFAKVAGGGHWVGLGINTSVQDPSAYLQIPPPLLIGRGIRGYLLCRALPEKFVDVDDHVVIIAEVLDVFPSFKEKVNWNQLSPEQQDRCLQEIARHDTGLVYCERKYTKISEPIEPTYFQ